MSKAIKNLDFDELVRQPGFEWIRLYFEQNYKNKNFVIDAVYLHNTPKEEGVYYLLDDQSAHSLMIFNGYRAYGRGGVSIGNKISGLPYNYKLRVIRIRVI